MGVGRRLPYVKPGRVSRHTERRHTHTQRWEIWQIGLMDIQGALVSVWFSLSKVKHTADRTGERPSPGDGKRG